MEERAAEENEVVEKAERMGSVAMKSSAHLADLACPADLAYPALISPEFFFCGCGLIFLAWVVVGFIFVVVGWL